jgi:phenylacetate-CoA ligase
MSPPDGNPSPFLASVRCFFDTRWDRAARPDVEGALLERYRQQVHFAAGRTAFWRGRIPGDLLERPRLRRRDIEAIPIIDKQDLRFLAPGELLPDPSATFHLVRGTGGTTGPPVYFSWTEGEWRAATETIARFLGRLDRFRPLRSWNGYNQGHIAGPSFDEVVRFLRGTPLGRHFRCSDTQAVEEIGRLRANMLILPPGSGSGKGGSLEDLLAADPHFLRRLEIRAILLSSCTLSDDLLEEIRRNGVDVIVNLYGTTEVFPTAVSCELDPRALHLSQGHVFAEVVDKAGHHVRSGESGLVVVSRIGARADTPWGIGVAGGTQFFRLAVGDRATYVDEPCPCGRTSARLSNIERVHHAEEKLRGGCEQWE